MSKKKLPQISLCMIVKNESRQLKRCLQSVQNIVSEMIIVDTGSIDNTVEIAQSMGAKVYHHVWEDSFSKARNHSLNYATGSWILILDGDELLSADCTSLLHSLNYEDLSIEAFSFEIINFTSDLAIKTEAGVIDQIRLFRNHPNHRYDGLVHNQLLNSQSHLPLREQATQIQILHYGYTPTVWKAQNKDARISLHEEAVAEDPDNHYIRYNYGNHLKILKRYHEALEQFILAIPPKALFDTLTYEEKLNMPEFIWGTTACFLGAFCANKIGAYDVALSLTDEALSRRPKLIDARLRGAEAHLSLKQYQEVINILESSLMDDHIEVVKKSALFFYAPYRLGRALFLIQRQAQATSLFASILPNCTDVTVFTHLCLCAAELQAPVLWRYSRQRGAALIPDDPDWPIVDQVIQNAEDHLRFNPLKIHVYISSSHPELTEEWVTHLRTGIDILCTDIKHSIHVNSLDPILNGAVVTLEVTQEASRLSVIDRTTDQPQRLYRFPERYLPLDLARPEESAALLIAQLKLLS